MTKYCSNPLVSIVVTSFNQSPSLTALFCSLLNQSYENIEIVFLDDASNDNSIEIARNHQIALTAKFSKIHLETNSERIGAVRNLEKGFSMCSGDYVCYLEGREYYHSQKIERNLEFFELNPTYGAVHSDYFQVGEDYSVVPRFAKRQGPGPSLLFNSGWLFDSLIEHNMICAPTLMLKKELASRCFQFNLFEERKYSSVTYPALLNLAQIAKIGYIDEPLVFHKQTKSFELETEALIRMDAKRGRLKPVPSEARDNRTRL